MNGVQTCALPICMFVLSTGLLTSWASGYTYNSNRTEAYCTCYINWSENIADKLECTFWNGPNMFIIKEVLVNGQVKWQSSGTSSGEVPYFKIVVDGDKRTITTINPNEYLN